MNKARLPVSEELHHILHYKFPIQVLLQDNVKSCLVSLVSLYKSETREKAHSPYKLTGSPTLQRMVRTPPFTHPEVVHIAPLSWVKGRLFWAIQ